METKDTRYSRNLFAAFSTIVLAFIAATVYANWRALEIGIHTRDVAGNALPSIEHLVAANNRLRDLEAASLSYATLSPGDRPSAQARLGQAWADLDRELSNYLELPDFDGERELYASLPMRLHALDESIEHLLTSVDTSASGRIPELTDAVEDAAAGAVDDVLRLVQFNASHVYESATRIDALRAHAAWAALVLDGVALLVAVAATLRVWRLFREHTRLLRNHGELLERRASELESFGRRIAHDLLSPLSALTFCLSAFRRASEADPALRDASQRARACVLRAQSMVEGIFEFSRAGGTPSPGAFTDVREIVEQVREEVCTSELRERPEVEIEPFAACAVACAKGVLVSILTNLMRNAAKYMSDSPLRRITVRVTAEASDVRIEVQDTGPGIAPELRESIFEPYVRAEGVTQPGLGLGLATVKRLCVAHAGNVGVESTLGRGSLFWVTLPKARSAQAEPPSSGAVLLAT
jgi:signal transduction histidine kinase